MTRGSIFNSPFLLGFDAFEEALDRIAKSAPDGYPPYNVEAVAPDRLRITLAVAGFDEDDLSVSIENNELKIVGRQAEDGERVFLHRGIAARQFQRRFVLADGMQVVDAHLDKGLLHVDLVRPQPEEVVQAIKIRKARDG